MKRMFHLDPIFINTIKSHSLLITTLCLYHDNNSRPSFEKKKEKKPERVEIRPRAFTFLIVVISNERTQSERIEFAKSKSRREVVATSRRCCFEQISIGVRATGKGSLSGPFSLWRGSRGRFQRRVKKGAEKNRGRKMDSRWFDRFSSFFLFSLLPSSLCIFLFFPLSPTPRLTPSPSGCAFARPPIKIFTWRAKRAGDVRARFSPISARCRRRVEVKEPHGPR